MKERFGKGWLLALGLLALGCVFGPLPARASEQRVILGDERSEVYLPLLEGKRVALFTNQTGIVGNRVEGMGEIPEGMDPSLIPFGKNEKGEEVAYGDHILDVLIQEGVQVTALFSPEHGVRGTGNPGEYESEDVDPKTGVPIWSVRERDGVYPSKESMETFDVLVVDIQDVGLRFYTYSITMGYLMEACSMEGKPVVILDRPNPNGFLVDGPILKEAFASGVGRYPVPAIHGLTLGELGQMANGEGWLSCGKDGCDLTVVPCLNYSHETRTSLIVAPSPNLKDMRAVYLYPTTCLFENTLVTEGRGTPWPFEIYGSPWLKGVEGYEFSFVPESMPGATSPSFQGEECFGRSLREIPLEEIWEGKIDLEHLVEAYHAIRRVSPEADFFGERLWIDKLMGTDEVRHRIEAGESADQIRASWQEEVAAYREARKPYLLYEDAKG